MKVPTTSLAVLAFVAIAGCSSGGSHAASSTTTTTGPVPPLAATSTTTRRRARTSTTTTTVTTTAPTPPSAHAVSATFVSPNQGFVLTTNGHVDGTTDGGRTWYRVGSLPIHGEAPRIRYIDAADGLAFGPGGGRPQFLVTHDSGVTWTKVSAPFTYIGDLEIARGMIYALGMPPRGGNFHIWETPVEHLVWTQTPPTQELGAGPVPIEQIVLNHGQGWITNQDRGLLSGARLTSNTSWATWTPPCLTRAGPAWLSASTADDLAASCDEGVWGGNSPKVTPSFWISHDGGSTFVRTAAPVFGPVLMANPQTAVVAGDGTLQRTTDGGATWSTVRTLPVGAVRDWGFTTSTQGFVITGGQMLMTDDAGATWRRVTLP